MKRTGIPLQVLRERLGLKPSRGWGSAGSGRYAHRLIWSCNAPAFAESCVAYNRGEYRPVPPGLMPAEEEFFDSAPLPERAWTLHPCSKHSDTFTDFPEEPD